jgi:hypothetical protein
MIRKRLSMALACAAFVAFVAAAVGSTAAATVVAQGVGPLTVGCAPTTGEMLQPVQQWALQASGGVPPYRFEIVKGELPSGLTLTAASGRISGTLDGKSGGRKIYRAQLTDSRGVGAQRECEMTIAAPPGWQIRICRELNEPEVQAIRLRVGIGGLESSHRDWTTWTRASDDLLTVPTIFRYAKELWIEPTPITSDPDLHRNFTGCVLFNHNVIKALEVDDTDPNEVSRDNSDSCPC